MQKNYYPQSKDHQIWKDRVRKYGCVVTGEKIPEIHYLLPEKAAFDNIWLHPWCILPLQWKFCDSQSDYLYHVTKYKRNFEMQHGNLYEHFERMVNDLRSDNYAVPNQDILNGIRELQGLQVTV